MLETVLVAFVIAVPFIALTLSFAGKWRSRKAQAVHLGVSAVHGLALFFGRQDEELLFFTIPVSAVCICVSLMLFAHRKNDRLFRRSN
jgi:hypothetical protein